jgi:hypothetical protein
MPEIQHGRWRRRFPIRTGLVGVALLLQAGAAPAVLLSEATSITSLTCVSVMETLPPIAAPVDYSCDRLWFWPIGDQSGPSRAWASTGFGDPLTVSAHVETIGAPQQISSNASSRIKFQLAIGQIETTPVSVVTVPVKITTAGRVAVAPLAGLLAGGGAYVSTTDSIPFTSGDVFGYTMRTTSPAVEVDEYDIVDTIYLHPEQVYFGNVYVGCNFAVQGSSACDGNASVSFVLDQAAFDAQMGGNTFLLAQYFTVQRSPNLVPEPTAALLGVAALGALVGCVRVRTAATRMPRMKSRLS